MELDAEYEAITSPSRTTPCTRLWAAVLDRAYRDVKGEIEYQNNAGRNAVLQRRAEAWIRSNDFAVGSFRWICMVLDLDPEREREKALAGDIPDLKTPGGVIRNRRLSLGLSQREFARRLHVRQQTLSLYERNRIRPPDHLLQGVNPKG